MTRIDPSQLLNTMSVLLGHDGGIRSIDEVPRIVQLMHKFSKKLVSKCIYIHILRSSSPDLLEQFLSKNGWELLNTWFLEAYSNENLHLCGDLVRLFALCPMSSQRLKLNPERNQAPKILRQLSSDSRIEAEVRNLATQVVTNWLRIARKKAMDSDFSGSEEAGAVMEFEEPVQEYDADHSEDYVPPVKKSKKTEKKVVSNIKNNKVTKKVTKKEPKNNKIIKTATGRPSGNDSVDDLLDGSTSESDVSSDEEMSERQRQIQARLASYKAGATAGQPGVGVEKKRVIDLTSSVKTSPSSATAKAKFEEREKEIRRRREAAAAKARREERAKPYSRTELRKELPSDTKDKIKLLAQQLKEEQKQKPVKKLARIPKLPKKEPETADGTNGVKSDSFGSMMGSLDSKPKPKVMPTKNKNKDLLASLAGATKEKPKSKSEIEKEQKEKERVIQEQMKQDAKIEEKIKKEEEEKKKEADLEKEIKNKENESEKKNEKDGEDVKSKKKEKSDNDKSDKDKKQRSRIRKISSSSISSTSSDEDKKSDKKKREEKKKEREEKDERRKQRNKDDAKRRDKERRHSEDKERRNSGDKSKDRRNSEDKDKERRNSEDRDRKGDRKDDKKDRHKLEKRSSTEEKRSSTEEKPSKKVQVIKESNMFGDLLSSIIKEDKQKTKKRRTSERDNKEAAKKKEPEVEEKEKTDKEKTDVAAKIEDRLSPVLENKESENNKEENDQVPNNKSKKGILVYGRLFKSKKSIRWAAEDSLVQVEYFEMNEDERTNVFKQKLNFQERLKQEKNMEKNKINQDWNKLSQEESYTPENGERSWKLQRLDLEHPVEYGCDSKEKDIQTEREKTVLRQLLFNNALPPDPSEPDNQPKPSADTIQPKAIPQIDLAAGDTVTDFTDHGWSSQSTTSLPPPTSSQSNLQPKQKSSIQDIMSTFKPGLLENIVNIAKNMASANNAADNNGSPTFNLSPQVTSSPQHVTSPPPMLQRAGNGNHIRPKFTLPKPVSSSQKTGNHNGRSNGQYAGFNGQPQVCKFFKDRGYCSKRDRCDFAHITPRSR